MKPNFSKWTILSFFIIGLALLLSAWSVSAANPESFPAPLLPYDGSWTGTTSRGQPMSYTVSGSGTQWSTFKLKTDFVPTTCGGGSGTVEITVPGPGSITSGQFSYTSTTYSFTGQFASNSTATGTYSFVNRLIVIGLPYPPYVCNYYLTQSGTWTASVPLPPPGAFGKSLLQTEARDTVLEPDPFVVASAYAIQL